MQNVIAAIFKNESEGYQALTELSKNPSTEQAAILELALVKRENNSFTVCDNYNSGINTTDDMFVGGVVGGILGILAGPIGVLLFGAYGALLGSAFDEEDAMADAALIEKVAEKMMDGEVALVGLVNEADESYIDGLLSKFDVEIARFDAAVVAEEVDEAMRVEKEMDRMARRELRKAKKEEHKAKVEERRKKMDEDFKASMAKFES